MTRTTNARLAGVTYFVYLAAGIASMALAGRDQATDVLSMVTSFSALVLGVTLYALTRQQDPDLAMLALACRVRVGFFGGPMSRSSPVTWFVWLPVLVFELALALWLITKGVATTAQRQSQ